MANNYTLYILHSKLFIVPLQSISITISMSTYITIIVTLILSAFCSGMEIAFLRSNKLRLEIESSDSGITDKIIQLFTKHPQTYITTLLVGNNIVLVIFSMKMSELLSPYFTFMQNKALVSFIITLIATLIVLFFGEFLPKNVSRNNPNGFLRALSPLAFLMYVILYPITLFCSWCTKGLLLLLGVKTPKGVTEVTFTRSDLDYLVEEIHLETPLAEDEDEEEMPSANELQILRNALDFSNVKIRDCFIPRTEVVALPWESTVETLKQTFQETGFSKIPIYKEDIDNIVGYIHCSEMFNHQSTWRQHINTIPFVPENMAAQKLMTTFMQQRKSIAVVVDEFGGTAGIVTLEDIMEEIFGEIEDEHDHNQDVSRRLSDTEVLLSGRLSVEEANERFDLHLTEGDDYETVGGLILHEMGGFPKINETIHIDGYNIKCLKIIDNRIELVKITV